MPPTTPAATPTQIQALLDFLLDHQDLARGLLRGADGRIRAKRLWDEITSTLNAMGGCVKTVAQWQRVWADRKFNTKRNAAASRKSACGTGGGPSTAPDLSESELKILNIMGEGFGEPQTGARVPAFPFSENSGVGTLSVAVVSPVPQADLIDQQQQQQQQELQPQQQQQQDLQPEQSSHRPQLRRPLRRQAHSQLRDTSIRGMLFKIEEERNEELRGIRAALFDLTNILKEVVGSRNHNLLQ